MGRDRGVNSTVMRTLVVVGLALALTSCKRAPADDEPASRAARSLPAAVPLDHLAPGELVEGTDKLFGLPVPRVMTLAWTFKDRGLAQGDIEPERVANYVRARVKDGKITAGASSTVFDGVHHASDPKRLLRIRIERLHGRCQLEVIDITPAQQPPDPGNDEARWRAAGFTPQGKPLDPMHQQ
jgi:hypothetical protein